MKNDHHSKFSNCKEEAWKNQDFNGIRNLCPPRISVIILHFDLQPQFKYMNYFIYTSHHFTPHGRYELNKYVWLHSSVGRASHRCSRKSRVRIPLKPSFFQASSFHANCLNWEIYCNDHSLFWSTTAVQIYELFHIYFTSFELNLYLAPGHIGGAWVLSPLHPPCFPSSCCVTSLNLSLILTFPCSFFSIFTFLPH